VTADELVLGSEELETLLHVLGDAAALPGRLAPSWQANGAERVAEHVTVAVRRTAAHSLLARGLVRRAGGGWQVEPGLAALLAVPTRPVIGFEFDLERDGEVSSGAACAAAEHGALVLPRADGTVLLRGFPPGQLAQAVVEVAGSAPPGTAELDLPGRVLAEPLTSIDEATLTGRGLTPEQAAALAGILRARRGSGRTFAVRRHGDEWVSSPRPVAWWDTDGGRYLIGPGPVDADGERLVNVRGCTDVELRAALAELTTVLI
jgi:hypothetical protein